MNERVVKNPNFGSNGEFHSNLATKAIGTKDYPNTHTEVEYLGNGGFAASVSIGHRVFFDKADGDKPKKHKLTDNRPDHVLIQSSQCCVEVYPYYARYYDVQHEEVRLYEERWVVQMWKAGPNKWSDVGAWNPVTTVSEYSEPAGDVVKVTTTYDTSYGILTVEYFQRDGNSLKHNITFVNTSGSTETFRVVQKWAGIVGDNCNGKDTPMVENTLRLAFHKPDKPQTEFTIAENLASAEQYLQKPINIETHAQGMKADFIYGDWELAQDESLEIDPATATLNNPTRDGFLQRSDAVQGSCPTGNLSNDYSGNAVLVGGSFIATLYRAQRGYVEWDISSLAGVTIDANPEFRYNGDPSDEATDEEINPITEAAPSATVDATLWGYIASGTAYVDPFDILSGTGKSQDLGATAKTDLQTAATAEQSWFAIGIQSPGDECPGSGTHGSGIYSEEQGGVDPAPTLYVEYTPSGWSGIVTGITDPAKVIGVEVANIVKVIGVE